MKKYTAALIILIIVFSFVLPHTASAAWWNPFSWKIFSWLPRVKKTPTVQIEQNIATSTAESNKTDTETKLELLKHEIELERAKIETGRLQAEKAKAEAGATKANTDRQKLYNELDAQKTNNVTTKTEKQIETNTNTETNKGIYCNETYWTQCTTGLEFVCPTSGNAYCRTPQSSVDLNRATNNKSELINLQNTDIAEQKKLLEYSTNEVTRVDRILNQLRGYTGLVIDLSIVQRNLFIGYKNVETNMVQYDENTKRQIEELDIAAFASEETVTKLRNQINTNISETSKEMYKLQSEVIKYNDSIRPFLPLNISL